MPLSRKRRKVRKEKGPTPKSTFTNKKIKELNEALDYLEEFERNYYEQHPEERPTQTETKEQ